MPLQHRKLIHSGGIKDHIRIFLERENPTVFPSAHRVPHGHGSFHAGAPALQVTNCTPYQAQKAGGNPVMVIQIQREGAEKRQAAEAELGKIEGELKAKLMELRG